SNFDFFLLGFSLADSSAYQEPTYDFLLLSTSCLPKVKAASAEVGAATIAPVTAASALRAAATCGAPTADARGWGCSRSGANDVFHRLIILLPPSSYPLERSSSTPRHPCHCVTTLA
ncbi:hypothetical protein CEXT_170331, partial [Caerostris extrusa]